MGFGKRSRRRAARLAAAVFTAVVPTVCFAQEAPRRADGAARDRAVAAPESRPSPVAALLHHKNGDRLLRGGDLAGAASAYARAALAAPRDPVLRLSAGVALASLRRVDAAAAQFSQAQALADDDVIAALLLQGALSEQGRTDQAQTLYTDTVRRFARADRPGLNADASIRRLTQAAGRFPDSAVVRLLLGDAYQVSEQWKKASDAYRIALGLAPRWSKPFVNLGVLHLAQNQSQEAMKAFQSALRLDPSNVQLRLLQGEALVKSGRTQAALQAFKKVENIPGVAAEASTRIGQIHLQNQQPDAALRSFNRARNLAPNDPGPVAGIGDANIQSGNFKAGADAYTSALRLADSGGLLSTRPVLYRGLAEAQLSAGDPNAAVITLRRALAEEPLSAPLWHRLTAEAQFARGDEAAGVAALRRALDSDVGRYPRETLNAIAARNLIDRITLACTKDLSGPARPAALVALAHLARYRGDAAEEIALRKQVTQVRALGTDWFLLATAHERGGGSAEARDAYARALELGRLPRATEEYIRTRLKPAKSATPLP